MNETQEVLEATSQPPRAAVRTRTYSWTDPEELAAEVMSASDPLKAMSTGDLPPPPFMATLDVDRLEVTGDGTVSVYLRPQEFHYNPLGSVHGGVVAALLDTAAAGAVQAALPAATPFASADLHARFLRPVTQQCGSVRCDGSVLSLGRRTALAQARLFDEAGRLLAHATSTCMILT